jgi:hypothetical protein
MNEPTIHVDYNPDHQFMDFGDTNGQPILCYRRTRELFPDGWVLLYEETWCDEHTEEERVPRSEGGSNPGDYVTGIADLAAVDEAVASAQQWLKSLGYREPL